jgi:hypothetical protein
MIKEIGWKEMIHDVDDEKKEKDGECSHHP